MKNFFKRLKNATVYIMGGIPIEAGKDFQKQVNELLNKVDEARTVRQDNKNRELFDQYLFDFVKGYQFWGDPTGINAVPIFGQTGIVIGAQNNPPVITPLLPDFTQIPSAEQKALQETTILLRPVDVVHELELEPTPYDLKLLDHKIAMLKSKEEIIGHEYSKREMAALIERLQNRKVYARFKDFYEQFKVTTEEKIAELLKKHTHLSRNTSDLFVPEFPDIAITRMKEYTAKTVELCNKKPAYYVIAKNSDFQKVNKKRDPILLAQSPFSFSWYILGAWDEEMILLSEL